MSDSKVYAEINYSLLKRARKKAHLTLKDASAGLLDVSELHDAEDGKSKIPFDVFRNIAHRYGKNINYFYLTDENAKQSEKFWKKTNRRLKIINYLIKKWHLEGEFDQS